MTGDRLASCELWELTRPAIPPRSRLFHLEPIGIGTPWTESLTGYVARLADAHGVLVRELVLHEILPLLDRPHLATTRDPNLLSAFWRNETRALNGTRTLAQSLVRALEHLTERRDLRFLTLLTWTELLPRHHLQRPTRAWCPTCYDVWQQAGQVMTEPLLWTLAPITTCARHGRRLEERCPDPTCGRPSPVLGGRSRPGHCARCEGWLGRATGAEPADGVPVANDELPTHAWLEEALGELIAAAPNLADPPRSEQLSRAIDASVAALTAGNRRGWARQLGLGLETAVGWREGRTIPSLGSLLQICSALGTTPLRLLQGDVGGVDRPTARRLLTPLVPRRPRRTRTTLERDALRQALEAVLVSDEQPPPSLRAVADRLGETTTCLRHHLRELCHAISQRHLEAQRARGSKRREQLRAAVRQATFAVHAQGRYPSGNRVAQLLSEPTAILTTTGRAAWQAALHELGWQT
jgi:hypothetical protein